jgi:RluA family pseudouridine synthase
MNRRAKDRQQRGEEITDYEFVDVAESVPEPNPDAWRSRTTPLAGERAYVAEEADDGVRLDRYLAQKSEIAGEALSRTRLQGLIEEGKVLINGRIAKDGKTKVRPGFAISIDVPEAAPAEPMGENIPLNVVYEDDELIVIDKPAGLVVHPASGHETGTLVNALIAHCGESLSGIGGVKRPGIVHRIDKDTTGLLVIAKTDAAHQGLAALFADHGLTLPLEREYRAIVWGVPSRARGTVARRWAVTPPIAKSRRSSRLIAAATPSPIGNCRSASLARKARQPPLCCRAGWRRAAPTRSACIWPISPTRCSATPSTAPAFAPRPQT